MRKKVNIKSILVCIAIPLLVGGLSSLLIRNSFSVYETETLPPLAPPPAVFPIVWAILYILMGVSSYLIWQTDDRRRYTALTVYGVQLLMNFIWPLLFFALRDFLFALSGWGCCLPPCWLWRSCSAGCIPKRDGSSFRISCGWPLPFTSSGRLSAQLRVSTPVLHSRRIQHSAHFGPRAGTHGPAVSTMRGRNRGLLRRQERPELELDLLRLSGIHQAHTFVRRMQWVSTTTLEGFLNTSPSTRFAVLRPTPGSRSRSSIVSGTRPPYSSTIIREAFTMSRALPDRSRRSGCSSQYPPPSPPPATPVWGTRRRGPGSPYSPVRPCTGRKAGWKRAAHNPFHSPGSTARRDILSSIAR